MGEQKQSHLQGTLQDSGYWEEGEKFRERGFPGRRREGGVSMHTSAQHLKSLCSAVESLTGGSHGVRPRQKGDSSCSPGEGRWRLREEDEGLGDFLQVCIADHQEGVKTKKNLQVGDNKT